ncbi:TauD/TfdA family dioxygenase [Falsiroseomonas sp.]|uniref:TauD/TfdA family dioxygenase n=1 Tax=Falsiroseomonas sp. TaxID=2870721 RepID=UPI0035680121
MSASQPPPARSSSSPPVRPRIVPQVGPAAWRAADLRPADWMVPLGAEDAAEIEAALAALGGRAPVAAGEAAMPRLGAVLRQAATRLDTGRGFVLLRGLPMDRLGEGQAEALLLVLGVHLGGAIPQGEGGELVQRLASPATGAERWRFHADAADAVVLLTLRQPPEVDPAMLVAAAAVHNEMLKRDRAALELLYAPLPHLQMRMQGPDPVAEPAAVDLPVFSTASGAFVGRYARDAIEAAQRLPHTPRLTAAQVEALDLLDAICAEPGLALRMEVRPGDVLLFNPLQVWKRRAESPSGAPVAETPDAGGSRQALRLLLLTPNSRALPEGLVAIGESDGAGEGRGGMVGG